MWLRSAGLAAGAKLLEPHEKQAKKDAETTHEFGALTIHVWHRGMDTGRLSLKHKGAHRARRDEEDGPQVVLCCQTHEPDSPGLNQVGSRTDIRKVGALEAVVVWISWGKHVNCLHSFRLPTTPRT